MIYFFDSSLPGRYGASAWLAGLKIYVFSRIFTGIHYEFPDINMVTIGNIPCF